MDNHGKSKGPHVKIQEMFAQGQQFTEEVLQENERLRLIIGDQRNQLKTIGRERLDEVPQLKARISLLEEENRCVQGELHDIKEQYNLIEKESQDFSERYLHVERQNTSLLNLYVASQRLHSTLNFREVLQVVQELVINLIGSEAFEICLFDPHRERLLTLAAVGDTGQTGGGVPLVGPIDKAIRSGNVFIAEFNGGPPAGDLVACVPLLLGSEVLGAVIIRKLLSQKNGFVGIDHELFELLGEHAAAAIAGAFLYGHADLSGNPTRWSQRMDEMIEVAITLEDDNESAVLW